MYIYKSYTQYDSTHCIINVCLRRKNPRLQKTIGIITSQEWTLQDWPLKLRVSNQEDGEMLDDREDDGRIVFGMEQDNKSLPWSRWWCLLFIGCCYILIVNISINIINIICLSVYSAEKQVRFRAQKLTSACILVIFLHKNNIKVSGLNYFYTVFKCLFMQKCIRNI
jgi:hypothetical protein